MKTYRSIQESGILHADDVTHPSQVGFGIAGATKLQVFNILQHRYQIGSTFDGESNGFVYFVQRASGPIKIGFSANPEGRIASLATSSHEELLLLGAFDGTTGDERSLHDAFSASRLSGEWFEPSPDLWQCILSSILNEKLSLTTEFKILTEETACWLDHWCHVIGSTAVSGRASKGQMLALIHVIADALGDG